ncbi:small acid-soluble spore protein H [Bacillaceae bacterium Marseille-Q3522]|nr:small acid-soluble spore protein H [Bacillaceae bacterium Marseille-Q3522]
MDKQRAQEIVVSPDMVNVTYEGVPIYIQHVDENKETARIYPLNEPDNEQEVPLNKLHEHEQFS